MMLIHLVTSLGTVFGSRGTDGDRRGCWVAETHCRPWSYPPQPAATMMKFVGQLIEALEKVRFRCHQGARSKVKTSEVIR